MDKKEAHYILLKMARRLYSCGCSYQDFIDNFVMCLGFDDPSETKAYSVAPYALEHVAHWVWFPIKR